MTEIGLAVPESGFAYTLDEALEVAGRIGYPLIVRPSYILGGRAPGSPTTTKGWPGSPRPGWRPAPSRRS